MVEELKILVKNKKLATYRVEAWMGTYTKQELSDFIGISRPTLNDRLKLHNWRMKELESIEKNLPLLQ